MVQAITQWTNEAMQQMVEHQQGPHEDTAGNKNNSQETATNIAEELKHRLTILEADKEIIQRRLSKLEYEKLRKNNRTNQVEQDNNRLVQEQHGASRERLIDTASQQGWIRRAPDDNIICFSCHLPGHFARNCPAKRKKQRFISCRANHLAKDCRFKDRQSRPRNKKSNTDTQEEIYPNNNQQEMTREDMTLEDQPQGIVTTPGSSTEPEHTIKGDKTVKRDFRCWICHSTEHQKKDCKAKPEHFKGDIMLAVFYCGQGDHLPREQWT